METGNPRVSVVMITHNRRDEVLRSLEQLTRLPEQPPIQLVDNGSTDNTAAAVAERFPQVELIALGENRGAAGRTLGVERARSPYVAFCDDDTWWQPGALSRAVELFEQHPRLAVITGRILVGPEEREDPICKEFERSPLPDGSSLPGYPLLGFMAGASVVRRSAFLEAGGFHERFLIGGEEELLALDLAARGWFLRYMPDIVLHHYPSLARDGHSRRWLMIRNALWSTWLRRPLRSALRRTLWHAQKARRDRLLLKSFAAALAGLPWILRARCVVPPEVEHGLLLLEDSERNTSGRLSVS